MPDVTLQDFIRQEAQKAGVPPELALAIAQQESGMNPATKPGPPLPSGQRALGIMQLLPTTAKARGINADDPIQNIRGGIGYLRELLDQNKGDLNAVLRAYGGVVTDTTYVPSVLGRMRTFSAQAQPTSTAPPTPQWHPPLVKPWHPPMTDTTPPPEPRSLIADIAAGFDPRTRTGRRNLAGAAGATAVGVIQGSATGAAAGAPAGGVGAVPGAIGGGVIGGVRGFLTRTVPIIAGAAFGGGAAETGEQAAEFITTGAPPRPGEIASAAVEQGMYEAGGQAMMWPVKAIGRRAIASRVGTKATEALSKAKSDLLDQLGKGLEAANQTAASVKQRLAGQGPPLPRARAGRMAVDVLEGPAKNAKDIAGRAVEGAAETGPAIAAQPLRDRLTELSEQITPQIGAAGPSADDLALIDRYQAGSGRSIQAADTTAYQQALKRIQAAGAMALPADHPLPSRLNYIRSLIGEAETIPYAAAHQIKRLLDDTVKWDHRAKKLAEQITKGFRLTLRDAMKGHAPYDEATAAYATVSRLHDKGIAPQLLRVAESNPEKITAMIKGTEPTKLQMLKDLFLVEAPKGGGTAEGQAAWDAVRASWTHTNVTQKGVEKIPDLIAKMDPDFVQIMYGDQTGQTILGNLQQLSAAYQTAVARAEALAASEAKERSAKGTISAAERALKASSLRGAETLEQEGADLAVAAVMPAGFWKARAIGRLLKGPKVQDLVTWAAYSPKGTQVLVKAFTNPALGMMASDLLRYYDAAGLTEDLIPQGPPSRAVGAGPLASSGPPPRPSTSPLAMTDRPTGWQDADEQRFQQWYANVSSRQGLNPNPDDPTHAYNYRHAFKAGAWPDAEGHWPSEFKAANHPNRFVNGIDTVTGRPATR